MPSNLFPRLRALFFFSLFVSSLLAASTVAQPAGFTPFSIYTLDDGQAVDQLGHTQPGQVHGATAQVNLTRTPWEMHSDDPIFDIDPLPTQHEAILDAAFLQARIPDYDDSRWTAAPNPDIIGFIADSKITRCGYQVDYNYFQTLIDIPEGTDLSRFTVEMSGVDDLARITIYNKNYPDGGIVPFRLGQHIVRENVGNLLAWGPNRIVITQVDWCRYWNLLALGQILFNGQAIPTTGHHHSAHWSYDRDTGPDAWGGLSPDYIMCSTGVNQSPIDFVTTDSPSELQVSIHWTSSALGSTNNGHTLEVNSLGPYIEIDDERFVLAHFHFHAPSEHTLSGRQMAMETHFVHKSASGAIAVISVLHEEGAENTALAPILATLTRNEHESHSIQPVIDLNAMLPSDRTMYHYRGSLTTPACTEDVQWLVFQMPTSVSEPQVSNYRNVFPTSARPTQPLGSRQIRMVRTVQN